MTIYREIGPSYHHKPIVQGVNYSPLMVESKEGALVKEERWPEAIPAMVLSVDFVSQEHGVPRNGPKDSNAGG
jgi:hypothetical protein